RDLLPEQDVRKAVALVPISLSKQQLNAIVRVWMHEVSYVQGPPGTGKSHSITAIMLSALFLKKSVLLVSHKKPAIDVVFDKLEAEVAKALEMEKEYYHHQEQLDRNRKAYLKRFGAGHSGQLKLSDSASVPHATAVLGSVQRWLGDELNTNGSISRLRALQVR